MPPELMALLQGGGDPAAAAGGGDPIAALLGGGGAPPPGEAPPGGPGGDPEQMYQTALEATDDTAVLTEWCLQAMQKAAGLDPDQEDRLLIQKIMTELQQYLATHQKREDQLLQGKADPAALRFAEAGY